MTYGYVTYRDFSGGLDLSSDVTSVSPNRTQFSQNLRIASDGSLEVIPGYNTSKDLGVSTNARDLYWFEKSDGSTERLIIATKGTGSNGKWIAWTPSTSGLGAGTYTDIRTGLTAVDGTTFVSHGDRMYGLDPLNDVATWDGTTLASYAPGVSTGPPRGIILGIWQNRMWVAKATSGSLGMRVEWSAASDPTNGFVNTANMWPANNYVELGSTSGTSERIVGGQVIPDGLLVFTNRATYLIYDDSTGAYTVLDRQNGCLGRRTIQTDPAGRVFFLSEAGIRRIDGRLPSVSAAPGIDPHFRLQGVASGMEPCGAVFDGSYWCAFLPNDASASSLVYNRAMFEVSLGSGAAMWHTTMATSICFAPRQASTDYLPDLIYIESSGGRLLLQGMAGSNSMSSAMYMLPYHPEIATPFYKRMHRVFVRGNGTYSCTFYPTADYEMLYGTGFATLGSFPLTYPDGQSTVEFERGRAVVSGVSGMTLSGLLSFTSPSASLGSPSNPIPIGSYSRLRGPSISQVDLVITNSGRVIP